MKQWIFLAGFLLLFSASTGYLYLLTEKEKQQVQDTSNFQDSYHSLQTTSAQEATDQTFHSVIAQQQAIRNIESIINDQPTLLDKRKAAASSFMGFYLVNTRTRQAFCSRKGVALDTYNAQFKLEHDLLLIEAKKLLFKDEGSIDAFYQLIKEQGTASVAQDMSDIANMLNISLEEACVFLNSSAQDFVPKMSFANTQPLAYKYLTAPKD